jgi:antitoxin (DNA-binding transcriptional repressor) of toxin-antitoxin stability system
VKRYPPAVRYTASVARERLADLLDAAEAGEPVIIERRGVEYTLAAASTPRVRQRPRRKLIAAVDKGVLSGNWTWNWQEGGLSFAARRRR